MPRVVREHEVLRVAGWMPGDQPSDVANSAINEVLKWAQNRCGGRLPAEAWRHEPFEYLAGGRNSSCVRLQSADADIWALRADDPDKTVPGRVWTNEVVIGLLPNQPARFSARLLCSTQEDELLIEPHTPGFVQQVVEKCRLARGSIPIFVDPLVVSGKHEADGLIKHLVDPKRELPTFVITLPPGSRERHPWIDAGRLARAMLGIAHVAIVEAELTWRLTNRFGKFRSVFGGAVRAYMPGFDENDDPFVHKLVLADQIRDADSGRRCERWMRQLAAAESIRRARLGSDVLAFPDVRNAALKLRQTTLSREGASEGDQLAAANTTIAALEKDMAQLRAEQNYYVEEHEKERQRAEAAERQAQASAHRIQELTKILKRRGDDPDQGLSFPKAWPDLGDWCDTHLSGRLVLTPVARRNSRAPEFADVQLVARCLLWLATTCLDWRANGGDGSLREAVIEEGVRNSPCGSDSYEFDWNGRRFAADWHVKNGGNTRDPARCLRIYYCFDEQTQQIIVSDLPAHRKTPAT
jgi:hypothetical protein